jgi:hypothetical protein
MVRHNCLGNGQGDALNNHGEDVRSCEASSIHLHFLWFNLYARLPKLGRDTCVCNAMMC